MRQVLFLLLLSPALSIAQYPEWDATFFKTIPAGLGKSIHLPERDYNPTIDTIDFRQKDRRVVVITEEPVYKKLFWRYVYTKDSLKKYGKPDKEKDFYNWLTHQTIERYLVDSLPIIDFNKYELVLYAACGQCLTNCKHGEGHDFCHRNACYFREAWFIREKKKVNL